MNTLKAVLKHLNKEDNVELSSEIVELGVAQELKTLVNALNAQLSIDERVIPETRQLFQEISSLINKAKDRAKTNESVSKASEKKTDIAIDALKKAESAAKDLGFKPTDIPNYKEVKKLADEVLKNIFELEDWNGKLKNVIK